MLGLIDHGVGLISTSINFNFPYASRGHRTDDDLKHDMEKEVRKVLANAAQFR